MNNRKSTTGRKIVYNEITKLVGYTVRVKHGSLGYKNYLNFREHVRVIKPKGLRNRGNDSDQQEKLRKQDLWWKAGQDALNKAQVIANGQKFDCVLIPVVQRTSVKHNLTL